jgi:hypothetical protein
MSWGNDISQAQQSLRVAPMALIYPSIALTVTVLAFILLGELVRDALDPSEGPPMSATLTHRCCGPRPARRVRHAVGQREVLHGVSFDIFAGETLAIVGESDPASRRPHPRSSTCCRTGHVTAGSIMLDGQDLTGLTEAQMEDPRPRDRLRAAGSDVEPQPVWSIGFQVKEAIRATASPPGKKEIEARAIEVLQQAGLADADKRCTSTRTSSPAACASAR